MSFHDPDADEQPTADTHVTGSGEVLDWICWMHYGPRARSVMVAVGDDPTLGGDVTALRAATSALAPFVPTDLRGVVEAVLVANPGLADLGEVLPAGTAIRLPAVEDRVDVREVVHLWDD